MSLLPKSRLANSVFTGVTAVGLVQNTMQQVAFAQAPIPVAIIFGQGTVSTSNPLPVTGNFTATLSGNISNATSLATTATNLGVVGFNYLFNGTSWIQSQGDASGFQKVNIAAGLNANGQAVMATSAPVAIASDQKVGDPCMFQAKISTTISSISSTILLVTGVAAKKIYICSLAVTTNGTTVFNIIEGTGATCVTANNAAVIGNTNATAGMPFTVNGGITLGNGAGTIANSATATTGICTLQTVTALLGGVLTYVQQ